MREEMAKLWVASILVMFIFTCLFGMGWLVGIVILMIIGFIKFM